MKKSFKNIIYISILVIVSMMNFSCEKSDEYIDWKAMNDDWFESHKSDEGFIQTASGLCYKVIRRGNTADRQPNPTSYVNLTFTGKLIDGTVFSQGEKVNMGRLHNLVEGLQEGLIMMHTGDIYQFYIPQKLGYGDKSSYKIPAYSTLFFEVELIDSGL